MVKKQTISASLVAAIASTLFVVSLPGCFYMGGETPPGWMRTAGGPEPDEAFSCALSAGGQILFAGATKSFGGEYRRLYVGKMAGDGTLVWEQAYGTGNVRERAVDMVGTADGGIAVLTEIIEFEDPELYWLPSARYCHLLRLDAAGEVLWTQSVSPQGHEAYHAVVEKPGGGFVLAGTYSNDVVGTERALLALGLDADGGELWRRVFSEEAYENGPTGLAAMPDGQVVVAGNASATDIFVTRIDEEGDQQGFWTFSEGDDSLWGAAVTALDEGGVVIAATRHASGSLDSDIWLLALDAEGGEQWRTTVGGDGSESVADLMCTSDGAFLLAGDVDWEVHFANIYFDTSDALLMKVGATGQLLWSTAVGFSFDRYNMFRMSADIDSGAGVVELDDGGYVLVGTTGTYGAGWDDVFFVGTDAGGSTVWTEATME